MGLDYYAILDLPRDCLIVDIKLAYRRWALASHPQRKPYPRHPENPPEGIPDDFPLPALPVEKTWKLVNEAYDVLSNSLTREVYDLYGEEGLKDGVPAPNGYIQPYCYHGDCMRTYNEVFGTYSPYADLIDAVTNPPPLYSLSHGMGVKSKDKDIEKLLYLDLYEIFHGGIKKMKILRHEFVDVSKSITKIKEKILIITITPGILPGTRIKFREEGDQSPTRIPADIIFIVADKPHDTFSRCGPDLHMIFEIDLKQALVGINIPLTTIDDRKLVVPITDVITPSYIKTIKGEGLPVSGKKSERGDLLIKFKVDFPTYIPRSAKVKLLSVFKDIECGGEKSSPEIINKMILNDKMDRIAKESFNY